MIPISKPLVGEEEKQAVMAVLESGMLVQGPRVQELEQEFARRTGAKHAVATSSGTTALHAALLAHGIGPGDEVITTPFTFIASVNSIIYTGARPVFVDILPCCFNIDPRLLEAAITPKTKAILPVHLFGMPASMDAIDAIARKRGLAVIQDAAQAVGALSNGKQLGALGTACYSLYATKNIHCAEGGVITTNDDEVAQRSRLLRAHGSARRYYHDVLGFNFRLSDLHAAIAIPQLRRLDDINAMRARNAEYLSSEIHHPLVVTPDAGLKSCRSHGAGGSAGHVWHQYTIRVLNGRRDEFVAKLAERGIGASVFYPIPAHRQRHILDLCLSIGPLPVAEHMSEEVLSLPVHPALSAQDLVSIAQAVNSM